MQTDSTTIADLQSRALDFVERRDWGQFHSPRNLAMAVSVEASELLELFLWTTDDGPQPLIESRQKQVEDEAADIMICLLNFCTRAGVDLAGAVDAKLQRAEAKYPVERVRGKALKYHEYDDWDGDA